MTATIRDCEGLSPSTYLYNDDETLRHALRVSNVSWDTRIERAAPLSVRITPREVGAVKLMSISGEPITAVRGPAELARDDGAFIGVLYQRTGRTVYARGSKQTDVTPGDIAIWHSAQSAQFTMPERFHKLCMLVPAKQFEELLPGAALLDGLRVEAASHTAALLGSWLTTFADNLMAKASEPLAPCIDTTLDVLSATVAAYVRKPGAVRPRDLLSRITQFIDRRLDDPALTPATIAEHFGISLRYLHRLFSEQQTTVNGWRRARRLAKCRAELSDSRSRRSITEIAYMWGFSDAANFSRVFKMAFGVSPKAFRNMHREERSASENRGDGRRPAQGCPGLDRFD
jgi:AraC-like DNA-binding protein